MAKTVFHLPPPVESTASREYSSVFSTASVNNLPIMPIECNANARMPASGPMPRANVNTAAKTSVGIALAKVIIARPMANTTGFGVVFRAARKASGMLSKTETKVPINAIQIVSIVASITVGKLSKFGGSMYEIKFHRSEKPPKIVVNVMSMNVHDQTVAAT